MKNYFLNSFVSGIITSVMIFTPTLFAKAKQPSNPQIEGLKQYINVGKFSTAKTFQEVWGNLYKNLPRNERRNARLIFSAFNQQKLPKMKFQEFQYKGKSAVRLITQISGQNVVIEYLFNGSEIMKVNGVLLTANDLKNEKTLSKKIGHLSFVKNYYTQFKKNVFSKPIMPSYKVWQKFSPRKKAEFLLRYRQLLAAARKVYGKNPVKVVSDRSPASDSFVKAFLLGEDAFAENAGVEINPVTPPPAHQDVTHLDPLTKVNETANKLQIPQFLGQGETVNGRKGPSCIIAGYAMEWSGNSCKWSSRKSEVFGSDESKECQTRNGSGWVACQPITYIQPDGSPVCINTKDRASLQKATHPDGPCEAGSKLSSAQDKKNFIDGWLKRFDPSGKLSKKNGEDLIQVKGNKLYTQDKELYNKITGQLIQPLTKYIESAYSVCIKDDTKEQPAYKYNHQLKNPGISESADPASQNQACDGLLKRSLAIKDLFEPIETPTDSGTIAAGGGKPDCPETTTKPNPIVQEQKCTPTTIAGDDSGSVQPGDETPADPYEPGVDTVEAEEAAQAETASSSDCSFYQSYNPRTDSCGISSTFIWGGVFLAGLGLCLTHTWGICGKSKKNKNNNNYIDPVPSIDPSTPVITTPTTPTTPTTAPRETQSNPATASGAVDSVR
ncbi:MAG: hypothetical protein KDD45_06540 [Bdellovibrionales bacterium]|nr:hypothetical protein [Bdellovibrionales bacterium]